MTGRVRDWLPHGVVTHDVVRQTLEQAITQWGDRWFADVYASVTDMKSAYEAPGIENDDGGWRVYRSAVAIRTRRQALARIVDRALDIGTEGLNLTEADRYMLGELERNILENLAEEVEQAFGVPSERKPAPERPRDALSDGGGLLVSLTDPSGREVLTLAVPIDVTLPRIKAQLGTPAPRSEALQPLTRALSSVNVAIEAVVGRVELNLTELNDLAVGDVLVLDRALDQAVDIAAAGSQQIFAKAVLTHVDDGIALVF